MTNRLYPPRDSPDYPWHARPAEHTEAGLFLGGPEGERNPLAVLIPDTHCRDETPNPVEVRRSMRIQRLLAAMHGKRTRNRRVA
jgi:hypothetical protein